MKTKLKCLELVKAPFSDTMVTSPTTARAKKGADCCKYEYINADAELGSLQRVFQNVELSFEEDQNKY